MRDNCNQRCSELPFSFIKLFKSIVIVSMSDDVVDNTSVRSQSHMRMPLNSSRITAGQLSRVGKALGLTSSGSIDDQRLMVEGKISEMGHELYNVQIVLEEYSSDASFQLCDEDGEFLTVPSADADHCSEGDEPYEEMASGSLGEERNEVELLRQSVTDTHSRKG